MSTPSAQSLVLKYNSPPKRITTPLEKPDSRAGAEKAQGILEHLVTPEIKEVLEEQIVPR